MNPIVKVLLTKDLEAVGASQVQAFVGRFLDHSFLSSGLGIDPGDRNMGLALVSPPDKFSAIQITLDDADNAVERITNTVTCLSDLLSKWTVLPPVACVECAAYSKLYGQVALAENRSAAIMALMMKGVGLIEVPAPGTIRKVVFGNGKTKAENVWPQLGGDSASALACAIYASRKITNEREASYSTGGEGKETPRQVSGMSSAPMYV